MGAFVDAGRAESQEKPRCGLAFPAWPLKRFWLSRPEKAKKSQPAGRAGLRVARWVAASARPSPRCHGRCAVRRARATKSAAGFAPRILPKLATGRSTSPPGERVRGAAVHVFKKILIANRGEIAWPRHPHRAPHGHQDRRGLFHADADALHVQMADEAVAIGPAPSAQSYLQIEKIIKACKDTGACVAVHPGYGFLSENQAFAAALRKMAISSSARRGRPWPRWATRSNRRSSPRPRASTRCRGTGRIPDAAAAVKIAREIGYPVMIKVWPHGGGKGMRIAHSDAETEEVARPRPKREERVRRRPRVRREIRRAAAPHRDPGSGRREGQLRLSRRARMLDPAPPPEGDRRVPSLFLDAGDARKAMGEQAVALAKAVGYVSAALHGRVHRQEAQLLLLESEHAAPGGASGHREDHGPRSRRVR
ncbi:MAG: biotin carboxylase N-terminal domain-containing protein [Alphaproteobacteria bacterium]